MEITFKDILKMYGNNTERIIGAAKQMGLETSGSWYVAARGLAEKANEYAALKEQARWLKENTGKHGHCAQ